MADFLTITRSRLHQLIQYLFQNHRPVVSINLPLIQKIELLYSTLSGGSRLYLKLSSGITPLKPTITQSLRSFHIKLYKTQELCSGLPNLLRCNHTFQFSQKPFNSFPMNLVVRALKAFPDPMVSPVYSDQQCFYTSLRHLSPPIFNLAIFPFISSRRWFNIFTNFYY